MLDTSNPGLNCEEMIWALLLPTLDDRLFSASLSVTEEFHILRSKYLISTLHW